MGLSRAISGFFLRRSKALSREGLDAFLKQELEAMGDGPIAALNIGSGGEVWRTISGRANVTARQVDIDPARAPDIVADVCAMPMIESGSIDAVFLLEVLEHVMTPQAALDEIRRVLKPGGRLVLSTPFIMPIHDEPHDYFRYTEHGLRYLLRDYGLMRIARRNGYYAAVLTLFGRALFADDRRSTWAAMLGFTLALLLAPLLRLLDRVYDGRKATTGYVVSARSAVAS